MDQNDTVIIRNLDLDRDGPALRACFLELQAFERRIVPAMRSPEEAMEPYLEMMLGRCQSSGGKVLVAEIGGSVIGFVSIWARMQPDPDDEPREYAWVSDLVVLESFRGRGIGRRLLEEAEAFARASGAPYLGIGVLAENRTARELYVKMGFAEHRVELVKRFVP